MDIVGGRFVHLQLTFSLLEQYKSDINVFKVKRRLFSLVSKEFENLGIQLPPKMSSSLLSNVTWSVATKLISSESRAMDIPMFNEMLNRVSKEGRMKLKQRIQELFI